MARTRKGEQDRIRKARKATLKAERPKWPTKKEVKELKKAHPGGFRLGTVVRFLREHGFRFSEATFRKYVQKGLVPRCIRVGVKGRHQGSHGLYPHETLDRVVEIKRLMHEMDLTLEQIKERFDTEKYVGAGRDAWLKGLKKEMVEAIEADPKNGKTLRALVSEAIFDSHASPPRNSKRDRR